MHIVSRLKYIKDRVITIKTFSDMTLFPDSSYSFYIRSCLNFGGQLDHKVIQCILFRGLSISKIELSPLKNFQTRLCFQIAPTVFVE